MRKCQLGLQRTVVADSVTILPADVAGAVAVVASHGGLYAAHMAAMAGVLGVVLNDAGVGLDRAGIAGLAYLDRFGIPAATIDCHSARIGDGADMAARGVISFANRSAGALGVQAGQAAAVAAARMTVAARFAGDIPPLPGESRATVAIAGARRPVVLVDSASLVGAGDAGAVVLTASHGGLLAGRPETAVKAPVHAALFNDAGLGADHSGISRLPALDARGIAGATVDAATARIGDARSAYENGILSFVNETARRLGARPGMAAARFAALMSQIA